MRRKLFLITGLKNDCRGFTLIEVMIAVVILVVGILAAANMQITATTRNTYAGWLTEAATEAQSHIEFLAGLPYEDPNFPGLADDDWDDKDGDGLAGLDDRTAPTADGNATSADGRYNIFWNVALNQPIANNKTVRVIVTWTERGAPKRVVVDYIKAQVI